MRKFLYLGILIVLALAVRIRANILNHRSKAEILSLDSEWKKFGLPIDVAKISKGNINFHVKISGTLVSQWRIHAYVSRESWRRLKVEQRFSMHEEEGIKGFVESISNGLDVSNGLNKIVLKLYKQSNAKIGKILVVHVNTSFLKNVIRVNKDAIFKENNISYCWLLENNKVSKQKVITGIHNDKFIEIKSGLEIDKLVVVSGKEILANGDTVRVHNMIGEYK